MNIQKLKGRINSTASKYISSGLVKAAAQTIVGFVILRWLNPEELGKWQSFTVFVGYIGILTLGVNTGLNRELPYLIGKENKKKGIELIKTAGFFATKLSIVIMAIVLLLSIFFYYFDVFDLDKVLMFLLAFSTGALAILTNFLGSTFRSSKEFNKLTRIQFINSILFFILLPLVYFFNIWGYIIYQTILALYLYLGYLFFRPYKVKYNFNKNDFILLFKTGFPIFFWNYIGRQTRTIPRLVLVLFGSPLLVGLFSPAGSINAAMLQLPAYTNRYLFPQMSFKFGKSNSYTEVFNYAFRASKYLFLIMLSGVTLLSIFIPYIFTIFFPKYIDSVKIVQIVLFSGVFYSVNTVMHNALNSIKIFKPFRIISILKIIYIILFISVSYYIGKDLLLSVAIGALMSEAFNTITYIIVIKKVLLNEKK
jgi:O-antigen/teichoic acid export membrane protein